MEKNENQVKTLNEALPKNIIVMTSIMIVCIIFIIIYDISNNLKIFESLTDWNSFNPVIVLIMFMLLYIIVVATRYIIYSVRKKKILTNGFVQEGELIDKKAIRDIFYRGPSPKYNYKYKVKLPDGNIIETETYEKDFVNMMFLKKCTVYKYKNKYYFTNFH
jgi:hypothetical protein